MKQHAPAAERNKGPIAAVLANLLPPGARVLELASGTGQHALHLIQVLPEVIWQPSDPSADARQSISAYRLEADPARMLEPLAIDAESPPFGPVDLDAVVCINMIHISPWQATVGLFGGGEQALRRGGVLVTYGPYRFNGVYTAESNREFDQDLRRRNPSWGVRDVADLTELAARHGFTLEATHSLPANNHLLVWRLG